jgi:hypothetical protein
MVDFAYRRRGLGVDGAIFQAAISVVDCCLPLYLIGCLNPTPFQKNIEKTKATNGCGVRDRE